MNKKVLSILMVLLIELSTPLFDYSADAYSTIVRYTSPGSSYYELSVPLVMAPGETAIVSATGTWEGTFVYYVDLFSGTINETEHSGIIPEGGTYYVSATDSLGSILEGEYWQATAVYEAGEKFPDEINVGDTYVYGDYEYRYQCGYESGWYNNYTSSNWGVRVVDSTKTSFGNMLSYINGKPVDTLRGTFQECEFLVTSPQLSTEAKNMANAFNYCINLVEPPVIPNKVTTLNYAFYYCEKLASAPTIPESVKDIGLAFYGCFSMSGTIEINSAELTYYAGALHNTQITSITGSISDDLKTQLLATIE